MASHLNRAKLVPAIGIFALLATQAITLHLFGQPAICRCGYVKLWEGNVLSAGSSQHLTDWYSFSHLIHGFLFYLLLWLLFPKMPLRYRILLALGIEVSWEIIENTPWLIAHYRQQALAVGYSGDSILNSLSDSFCMMFGFLFAAVAPIWLTVTAALGMEAGVGYAIHDNLTLNILNFLHPFEFIRRWQSGG